MNCIKTIKIYIFFYDGMKFVNKNSGNGFNLSRQTKNYSNCWENICLTDNIDEAKYYISIDTAWYHNNKNIKFDDVIFLSRECEKTRFSLWKKRQNIKNENLFLLENDIVSPTLWFVNKSYDFLSKTDYYDVKNKKLSCVSSDLKKRPGHKIRYSFISNVLKSDINIDLYGHIKKNNHHWLNSKKYKNSLKNKSDGLINYDYTLAIENYSQNNYFTEKLVDAYLCNCFPFYYGCKNISEFFPKNSYYYLDFEKYTNSELIQQIKYVILNNYHLKFRKEINIAKKLCLNNYQFWPVIKKIIDKKEDVENVWVSK